MTNEMIISESQSLYSDIDCCITELLKARTEHNSENEGKALFKMESLMVSTLQHLACIIEQPSLPSNIDEAAKKIAYDVCKQLPNGTEKDSIVYYAILAAKAGAGWMTGQGWVNDGSMPPETKHEGRTMQGHREWTESKPVLAWDSMYGPRVDITKNGKWMSEQRGGYTGQICHGIIAWRPIPEYKEKQ